jgi:hypothetical protein
MRVLFALTLAIVSASTFADTTATFTLPSGVSVTITEAPFDQGGFKVYGCTETSSVCLINGRIPFGTSSGVPKTYVKSIKISYHGQSYLLDASDMYNAWGTRPLKYKGVIRYFGGTCTDRKTCRFRGLFSDGAGSFVAEWLIVDGVERRTVLTDSDDVVNLFMSHIDPPVFQ